MSAPMTSRVPSSALPPFRPSCSILSPSTAATPMLRDFDLDAQGEFFALEDLRNI
jgi:hypothetical protein